MIKSEGPIKDDMTPQDLVNWVSTYRNEFLSGLLDEQILLTEIRSGKHFKSLNYDEWEEMFAGHIKGPKVTKIMNIFYFVRPPVLEESIIKRLQENLKKWKLMQPYALNKIAACDTNRLFETLSSVFESQEECIEFQNRVTYYLMTFDEGGTIEFKKNPKF